MLRIVILTQYFPPEMGAPQSRLYETAIGLMQLGWEVTVITALPNYPTGKIFDGYNGKFFVKEKINGIPVRRYWLHASNSKNALPRILNMITFSVTVFCDMFFLRRYRPAWLIAESPSLLTGLTGLMLARICSAKFVLNVSDIWPLSAAELGALRKEGVLYRFLAKLEQILYKRAYACMGQSQEIIDHMTNNGARRSLLFRNGVDTSRFKLQNLQQSILPLKIVYAGLLGVAQGILSLCKQLQLDSRQFELHIYGTGAERNSIEQFLQENKVKGIFLHNPVGRSEIPEMLAQYDLTLIPLVKPIYGAVPSKLYEAMAAGLPVLFAGGGEGAQIVETYKLGWICKPSDFKSMSLLLQHIATLSTIELEKYRKNCREVAQQVFDRKIQIANLHNWLCGN